MPAIAEGAEKAGRSPDAVDLIGAPFFALARDEEGVEAAKLDLKQHISFYASTPTYHSVLEFHGWMDAAAELHRLSREGQWKALPGVITDAMLDEWAIIATADEFVDRVKERCGDLYSTILLDLPPSLRSDDDWLSEAVAGLK